MTESWKYCRCVLDIACQREKRRTKLKALAAEASANVQGKGAVSYAQHDVYKRQVSNNVPVGQFFVDNPNLVHSLRNSTLFGASLAGKFMPMDGGFGPNQVLAGLLIIGLVVTLFFTQLHMMRKNMPPEALTGPLAQQQKTMLYILCLLYTSRCV